MLEDKLSHDERLRLECVAQAVNFKGVMQTAGIGGGKTVIELAKDFEKYVKGGPRVTVNVEPGSGLRI